MILVVAVIITFAFCFCFGLNFLSDEIEMFFSCFDGSVVLSFSDESGPPNPTCTHFHRHHNFQQPC